MGGRTDLRRRHLLHDRGVAGCRGVPILRGVEQATHPRSTTLRFGQRLGPQDDVGSVGPGWEYYLDRLVAVRDGRDVASIVWDDYFPVLQPYYEELVAGG